MIGRFRRGYGATPLHLLGHLVAFAIFAWAIAQILGGGYVIDWVAWFVGAAVLHDLVLLPAYSLIDRATARVIGSGSRVARNHLRVPGIISGVLLLVYFPVILGYSAHNYRADTGHALHGYLRNWLLITAGLFLASALVYAGRRFRVRLLADAAVLAAERAAQQPLRAPR